MRTALDVLRRLHDHRRWLRGKLIAALRSQSDAALRQPFPMGPGSALGIAAHCCGADRIWIDTIEGAPTLSSLPSAESFPSIDELVTQWDAIDERWRRFLASASEADLGRAVVRVREGKSYTTSLEDILIHVCTHQMYHAAQLKNMLRQLGVTDLPTSDYIVFARETWSG